MSKFETLVNEYRENKRMMEELQALNDEIKAAILEIMGDNDTMTAGAAKVTNKIVISSRLDSAALKKDHPDIFGEYSKESSYRRFTVV